MSQRNVTGLINANALTINLNYKHNSWLLKPDRIYIYNLESIADAKKQNYKKFYIKIYNIYFK